MVYTCLTVVTADEQAVNCACTPVRTFKINSNVRALLFTERGYISNHPNTTFNAI